MLHSSLALVAWSLLAVTSNAARVGTAPADEFLHEQCCVPQGTNFDWDTLLKVYKFMLYDFYSDTDGKAASRKSAQTFWTATGLSTQGFAVEDSDLAMVEWVADKDGVEAAYKAAASFYQSMKDTGAYKKSSYMIKPNKCPTDMAELVEDASIRKWRCDEISVQTLWLATLGPVSRYETMGVMADADWIKKMAPLVKRKFEDLSAQVDKRVVEGEQGMEEMKKSNARIQDVGRKLDVIFGK
mmetsp:Transcript_62289/g.115609  ORF Transcript_62289/g.115609 Transcript_62289/m.115609 type:complete len:241 (-) Transcript_62289:45-767(-)